MMKPAEITNALAMLALGAGIGAGGMTYYHNRPQPQPPIAEAQALPVTRTVTWFQGHTAEMEAKLAACHDNPGDAMRDPECLNAYDASTRPHGQ